MTERSNRAARRRTGWERLRHPISLWLGYGLSVATRAEAASPFNLDMSVESLLVLLAGVGILLVAGGVLTVAVRELRREAHERRRTYAYRRCGPERTTRPHGTAD